jgi:hypothetical protein
MRMLELADGCWKRYQWADGGGGGGGLFQEGEGAYMNRFGAELQGTTLGTTETTGRKAGLRSSIVEVCSRVVRCVASYSETRSQNDKTDIPPTTVDVERKEAHSMDTGATETVQDKGEGHDLDLDLDLEFSGKIRYQ